MDRYKAACGTTRAPSAVLLKSRGFGPSDGGRTIALGLGRASANSYRITRKLARDLGAEAAPRGAVNRFVAKTNGTNPLVVIARDPGGFGVAANRTQRFDAAKAAAR